MSTALPETAPTDPTAVTSVEAPAPAEESAVAEESVGSGQDEKFVPASRFNGLMSKFNQTQTELEALRAQVAEINARPSEQPSEEETTSVSESESSLAAQVNELSRMLVQERLEGAREKALRDYPEAAPFADLIVADTPEDVREMARLLSDRVKQSFGGTQPASQGEGEATSEPAATAEPATGEASAPAPEAAEPPVVGGGAAFDAESSAEDRVASAIQKGSFADFLNAKWEKQSVGGAGMSLG